MEETIGVGQRFVHLGHALLAQELEPRYALLVGAVEAVVPYALVQQALDSNNIIKNIDVRSAQGRFATGHYEIQPGESTKKLPRVVVAKYKGNYLMIYP